MASLLFFFLFLVFAGFSPANAESNSTFTPINRDLYHSSVDLLEQLKALVHRHPDRLASFGQHGRELITSELAFRILSILSEEQFLPNTNPTSLNSILDKLVIKDYDPYEENHGTGPFSEPETQIMRKLALSFDPHIWVNVHSGMEALFMPYDHRNTTPDGLPSQRMKSLLNELNQVHCHKRCMIGSGGGSVGYLAHGTATDYMYDIVKVPMAFTFEIYGDPTASSKDCFKMFNPVDLSTFNNFKEQV
ncbi:hypothetical protein GH714_007260 [Hevea brasiliensis]|uniref:Peptidase M14 domain-containing protein n=1 Tax=Hevea brasiliensis TaxID=3981 RepID=A0A6A6MCI6_HEVBR|nr:hypothetical protein GH714_007260 [Hevea brasiliensis]